MTKSEKDDIKNILKKNGLTIAMFCYFLLIVAVPHSRDKFVESLFAWIVFMIATLGIIGVINDIYKILKKHH